MKLANKALVSPNHNHMKALYQDRGSRTLKNPLLSPEIIVLCLAYFSALDGFTLKACKTSHLKLTQTYAVQSFKKQNFLTSYFSLNTNVCH